MCVESPRDRSSGSRFFWCRKVRGGQAKGFYDLGGRDDRLAKTNDDLRRVEPDGDLEAAGGELLFGFLVATFGRSLGVGWGHRILRLLLMM